MGSLDPDTDSQSGSGFSEIIIENKPFIYFFFSQEKNTTFSEVYISYLKSYKNPRGLAFFIVVGFVAL
jgi:hypothetical protein